MKQMIHFNRYLYIASLCLLTAACGDDNSQTAGLTADEPVPLQLGSLSIEGTTQTRATTTIPAGEVISVGAVESASPNTMWFHHEPYGLNKDSKWGPITPANTVYLTSKDVDLYIYYPWGKAISSITGGGTGFNTTQNTYQALANPYAKNRDICFAKITSVNAKSQPSSATTLKRILTRWKIKIKRKNYPGEGKVNSVGLDHTHQCFQFSPQTGAWTGITITGASTSTGVSSPGYILPATGEAIEVADCLVPALSGCINQIRIMIDNISYNITGTALSSMKYVAGTSYDITFVLNGTKLVLGTMTITDWDSKIESGVTPAWPSATR